MNHRIIIAAAAIAAMPCAVAEELDTEIAIERQVVPEHRAASRLSLLPELNLPAVPQVRLKPADRASAVSVPAYVSTLDPAAYGTTAGKYPWRGYASVGYFPAFNLGASAGYRLVDREATTVDAWLQYDGASWHGRSPETVAKDGGVRRMDLNSHTATAGIRAIHRVGSKSALEAEADYTYAGWNMPAVQYPSGAVDEHGVHLDRLNLKVGWRSRPGDRFGYSVHMGYGLMSYGMRRLDGLNPSENRITLDVRTRYDFAGDFHAGIDLLGDVGLYNLPENTSLSEQVFAKGLGSLRPYVGYRTDNIAARVGMLIDVMFNGGTHEHNGSTHVEIHPEVELAWMPSGSFTLWGRMSGWGSNNTFGEQFDWCRYGRPVIGQAYSLVELDTELGMTLGPWRGASLELRGGYATASRWLMPMAGINDPVWCGDMGMVASLDGVHYGATVSYKYRSIFEIRGSVDGAPSDATDECKGYYLWRDRARWVIDASVDVHPIAPLTISLGHNWRTGRRCFMYGGGLSETLGNVSSMRLGASYRITEALSVFARGENILDHRHWIMPGIPSQGVTGLIGVAYKIR